MSCPICFSNNTRKLDEALQICDDCGFVWNPYVYHYTPYANNSLTDVLWGALVFILVLAVSLMNGG